MNCYYLQSLKICTENEGIQYSLNDEQFDISMEAQDCSLQHSIQLRTVCSETSYMSMKTRYTAFMNSHPLSI